MNKRDMTIEGPGGIEPATALDLQTTATAPTSVLVVEDNPNMLFLADKILSSRGYRVLKASNGQMALDLYQQHAREIAAVLLDLRLPTMSGLDVLLGLSSMNPHVKVLVTSGYPEPEILQVSRERVRFLNKPYTPDELFSALENLTQKAPHA